MNRQKFWIPDYYFCFSFICNTCSLYFRVEILRYILIRFSSTGFKRNVIIVGDGKAGKMLATKLMYENPIGLNILGFVDDDKPVKFEEVVIGKKVLAILNNLKQSLTEYDVDELLYCCR